MGEYVGNRRRCNRASARRANAVAQYELRRNPGGRRDGRGSGTQNESAGGCETAWHGHSRCPGAHRPEAGATRLRSCGATRRSQAAQSKMSTGIARSGGERAPGRDLGERTPAYFPDVVLTTGFTRTSPRAKGCVLAFALRSAGPKVLGVMGFSAVTSQADQNLLDRLANIGHPIGQLRSAPQRSDELNCRVQMLPPIPVAAGSVIAWTGTPDIVNRALFAVHRPDTRSYVNSTSRGVDGNVHPEDRERPRILLGRVRLWPGFKM